MKGKMFFLISVSVIFIFSCNSDNLKGDAQKDEKIRDGLYAMVSMSQTISSNDKLDLLFTEDDIKSFKVVEDDRILGEIEFFNLKTGDLRFGLYTTVFFFLNDKLLFDPPIQIYSPIASMSSNDLQMNYYEDKIYFMEFYQTWDWLPAAVREQKLKAQEKNSQMRKKQWEVFILYLSDIGKIIE